MTARGGETGKQPRDAFRHCGHWKNYGTYRERCDADRAVLQLQHRGYQVRIGGC